MLRFLSVVLLCLAGTINAQNITQTVTTSQSSISLKADQISANDPSLIFVTITPKLGWHTYWQNPGDAGQPPTFKVMDDNIQVQKIHYPAPQKAPEPPLLTYGYKESVTFPVVIQSKDLAPGPYKLTMQADWLICKDICIPESATLSTMVTVQEASVPFSVKTLPMFEGDVLFQENLNNVILQISELKKTQVPYFFPETIGNFKHILDQQPVFKNGLWQLTLPKNDIIETVTGVLQINDDQLQSYTTNAKKQSFELFGGTQINLLNAVIFALLGGMILNIMPCVFPVLALKAASVLKGDRSFKEPLFYTLGIIASFLIIAVIMMIFRQSLGWGFQLQSPIFVLLMAFLFTAIALNFLGLWQLPTFRIRAVEKSSLGESNINHFFTGVLAVLVATPCTVPFMGAALGYALTQPAIVTLVVFTCLGIGLALPYILITLLPKKVLGCLPRSGQWLLTFKQFLAFPMLATVIWLLFILMNQTTPIGVTWALSGCLALALLIWLQQFKRGGILKVLSALVIILTIFQVDPKDIGVEVDVFSPEKVQNVTQPTFVNVSAVWCLTCGVNEELVLNRAKTRQLFRDNNVLYLKADWTFKDDEITQYLRSFNREGVPTYVYYEPGAAPKLLPSTLTYRRLVKLFTD